MRARRYVLVLLLLGGAACTRSKATPRKELVAPVPASAASSANARSPAVPSVRSASQSPSSSALPSETSSGPLASTTDPASLDTVHCKALGKSGLIPIGTLRSDAEGQGSEVVDLVVEGDHVVAMYYLQSLTRFTVTRYRRDGAPASVVGFHKGLGPPRSPILTADAVYFTRNRTLFRMLRTSGEVTELAKAFSHGIGIQAGYVYGFDCDAKKPIDRFQRILASGGNLESLAEIERNAPTDRDLGQRDCDYRSLISDGSSIYAAHWNGRRIVRYSLADHAMQEFVNKKPYPMGLNFVGDDVVFQSATGVYRASKTAANATQITELGKSPFAMVAVSAAGLIIHDIQPYTWEEWTYDLPWSTGKPLKIEYFKASKDDSTGDVGFRGLTIDAECIYLARQLQKSLVIYARKLP
jgi:hypothetical protein